MSLPPRAAVFDLDGTLADTAPDLIGAANALLDEAGLPRLDPAAARKTAGRGGKALIAQGFAAAGRPQTAEEIDALFPAYLARYEACMTDESTLFPGVEAALDRLAAAGWRLGVCTNKPERLAHLFLERTGLAPRFQAMFGADTLPVRKPNPRHLLATVEALGAAPERSVLIGDTITDRDAARNAEMRVVLVSFGYALQPFDELAPDALIDHFDALPETLAALGFD
ncbi:MAG: phosphoglycolate phosphatase [Pseudomonadota bacterium]